jgi:hypothetical protein
MTPITRGSFHVQGNWLVRPHYSGRVASLRGWQRKKALTMKLKEKQ